MLYNRILNDFARFLGFSSISHIVKPFSELDILRYIAHLYISGFACPSIVSRLSAITFWIKCNQWPLVTQSFSVSRAIRGVRSLSSHSPKLKFPITPDVLRLLCQSIHKAGFTFPDATRLLSMFTLAFYAFLRVGELCGSRHAIQIQNISLCDSYLSIRFPSFKFSAGRCPNVFIPACPNLLCPVRALSSYLCLRGVNSGSLFIDSNKEPISVARFRSELARVVQAANLASRGITPHSFRVGAATSAAALGIPEETIQRMGRWSSRAFMRYIKYQINKF